jgi:hypothetical protein
MARSRVVGYFARPIPNERQPGFGEAGLGGVVVVLAGREGAFDEVRAVQTCEL